MATPGWRLVADLTRSRVAYPTAMYRQKLQRLNGLGLWGRGVWLVTDGVAA
jgi:hypothetical protein